MDKNKSSLISLLGLWAFGMLVGANARDLLPIEPSLPPWLLLTIGLLGSFAMFTALNRSVR